MRLCRHGRSAGFGLVAALTLAPSIAVAHHSRAAYDIDETIALDGTVTKVDWRNPHVFIDAVVVNAAGGEEEWTFEGHSLAGFRALGWDRDTVAVGDRVRFVVNPSVNPTRRSAMLDNVTLEDGSRYYAFSIPEGETVASAEDRTPTAPSTDFSGTWILEVSRREGQIVNFQPPAEWPLTEAGAAQIAQFDFSDSPSLDCQAASGAVPGFITTPYGHRWSRTEDAITITRDNPSSKGERVIHLGGAPPADLAPDQFGYSVGRIEADGALVVETTHFAPARWGNAPGLDSSDQKRVMERYELIDEGYGLRVSYTLEDPVYLREALTRTGEYHKQSDYSFVTEPCEPEVARRHLEIE